MTATEQPQQSASALDLWNQQVQALTAPEHADVAINAIYENLMGLHGKLMASGNEKAAAKVEEAYNLSVGIYNMTTQQTALIAGGGAAIIEAEVQRNQAVTELQQLIQAINDGDESHPKLAGYAENIRQDEYESAMYDVDDSYYAEIFDDNVRSNIEESWEVVGDQGNFIYQALLGEFSLKKEHAQSLQRIISELPSDYAGYQAYKQAVAEEPDDDEGDE